MINYQGIAELAWRCTQTIDGLNGYYDWEKLDDVGKQTLDLRWDQLSQAEKKHVGDIVSAAIDAYAIAVTA